MVSSQIIYLDGKVRGLQILFSQDNFGYLAIGHQTEEDIANGFVNPVNDTDSNGFNEVKTTEDPTYYRIKLYQKGEPKKDYDTGKVSITFVADLDVDNIVQGIDINQFAICDSSDPNNINTTFYAASTFPTFTKTSDIAINFEIEMKI